MAAEVVDFNRCRQHMKRPALEPAAALPFVKWAGGKRSLIPHLAPYFPRKIGTYWEPFVGGGAVFFAFSNRIDRAYLSDTNEELVIAYQMVKSNVEALIELLAEHQRKHTRRRGRTYANGDTYYLRVRAQRPTDQLEVAARFIYLNKTCFNGLYRNNKRGQFNVPEGSYHRPDICNAERLREASKVLANATIRVGDFGRVVKPSASDLIYCDPPYDGTFTGYRADGFDIDDQTRLRDAANDWAGKGATVVLSNADTSAMRNLYAAWTIRGATAPRSINSNGSGRGAVSELVISSAT